MSALWILLFLIVQRFFELIVSARNLRKLKDLGGKEFYSETFPVMAALHTGLLLSLFMESHPWRLPWNGFTWVSLSVLIILQGMRYWCMASLGPFWNTRIVVVPGGQAVRKGPYRFLRHPNYLIVILEFLFLPLLLRAPFTFLVFFPLNLLVLRRRIALEERSLRDNTDYSLLYGLPASETAENSIAGNLQSNKKGMLK